MDKVQMQVTFLPVQSSSIDHHRPEALTCYNMLQLPAYSAKDVMRDQLLEALKPDKGFST
uniref:HECT domain-containing protein n=2 Tax=Echeneis naucrates TaxID=173247 RepID=A0A665TWT7_ECHNA